MASFRKPRGAYTRTTPDWFSDVTCSGGWFDSDSSGIGHYKWIGLYNDDNAGRILYVYAISASWDGANSIAMVSIAGASGSEVNHGVNIQPAVGFMPGSVRFFQTGPPAMTTPIAPPAGTVGVIGNGFVVSNIQPGFPIAKIPTGYSLMLTGDFNTLSAGAGFWYTPLKGD